MKTHLRFSHRRVGLAALVCILSLVVDEIPAAQDQGWPREIESNGNKLTIWQPQIDEWEYYVKLKARMAAAVTPRGSKKPILGALWVEADTQTDADERTVLVYNIEMKDARFEGSSPQDAAAAKQLARQVFPKAPMTVDLDRILVNMERTEIAAKQTEVKVDPPIIIYRDSAAVLLLLDGPPVLTPIKGTDLMSVVNTNWDLFMQSGSSRFFVLDEDRWLVADALNGPWKAAGSLPEGFSKLPDDENWAKIRKIVANPTKSERPLPEVIASTSPAELILTEGAPRMEQIPETELLWAKNSDSDLFFHAKRSRYYFLVSGRWFRAERLIGPWENASSDLPEDFSLIPEDHPRGSVRASVPGTPEAGEALIMAQIPSKATVSRDATAEVNYVGDEPEFEAIDGTSMAYATNSSSDVIQVGDLYYLCESGVWFLATNPEGPWVVVSEVPPEIYTIPPAYPVHRVTYVYVYDSTPDVVIVGYTPGYVGVYVWGGVVVYGTGYYYSPYVYYGGGYPIYYGHSHTYGMAAWYNPYSGTYARGAVAYGPYGGVGRGAAYNPHTGTYARGAAAWGPGGGTWAGQAYNPRTGVSAATRQSGNAYSHWGESVARRGNDWVHTGHYANQRGSVQAFDSSTGARGARVQSDRGSFGAAKGKGDDLYVGRDGNVYKRDNDGWHKNKNGSWDKVDPKKGDAGQKLSDRAGSADRTRSGEGTRASDRASGRQGSGRETSAAGGTGRTRDRGTADSGISGRERSGSSRSSQFGSGRSRNNYEGLNRDSQARSKGSSRSKQWKSGSRSRSSQAGRSGRSRGGGRRRR